MGDSGAYLLGVLMAASTLVVGGRIADQFSGQTYFFYAPIFIPLFILGVPILDVAWSIVRRTYRRTGFGTADAEHIHHRLMRLGHGQRRSVFILWAWTAILSAFVLFPTFAGGSDRQFANRIVPFVGRRTRPGPVHDVPPAGARSLSCREQSRSSDLPVAEQRAHEVASSAGQTHPLPLAHAISRFCLGKVCAPDNFGVH